MRLSLGLSSVALVAVSLSLAACGGGGSAPRIFPTSSPTTPATAPASSSPTSVPQYAARIIWTGGVNTPTPQTANAKHRLDTIGASPAPLIVALGPNTSPGAAMLPTLGFGAVANVQLSPNPSAAPVVSWADPNASVALSAPTPQGTTTPIPSSIAVAPAQVGVSTLTATVTSPIATTITQTVYTLSDALLTCLDLSQTNPHGFGLVFNADGSYGFTSTPTGADLYITGPPDIQGSPYGGCDPAFQTAAGSSYVLNAPAGIVDLGNGPDFPSITASQFMGASPAIVLAPAETSSTIEADTFLFKTALGQYVKFQASPNGSTAVGAFYGVFETSLQSGAFPF